MRHDTVMGGFYRTLLVLGAGLFITFGVNAQNSTNIGSEPQKWIRIRSDNGELSVEIPDEYSYFHNNEGLSVSGQRALYSLDRMNTVTSYRDGTFLSVDVYDASKPSDLLGLLLDYESTRGKSEKIKHNGLVVRQYTEKNERFYVVRQSFVSGDHVYFLTAASRGDETEAMKRFLNSVKYPVRDSVAVKNESGLSGVPISELKQTPLTVERARSKDSTTPKPATKGTLTPVDKVSYIASVTKPRAPFTNEARNANVTGTIKLRLTILPTGGLARIEILNGLGYGLEEQAMLAALRSKFIPQERNGKPETNKVTIEYGFGVR